MIELTTASIIEKNKISTDGVWLLLLEVEYKGQKIHLVNNTEEIQFNGDNYLPFPFNLSDITEDSKELPQVQLQVSNVTGTMEQLIEEYDGLAGANVIIRLINTNVPNIAEVEEYFVVTGTSVTREWAVLSLGSDYAITRRFPPVRMMKNFCPFKYKGIQCGYKGAMGECNKTLADCRKRNNSHRFGGEPSIPEGGLYE